MRQKGHEFEIFVTILDYEIRKVLSILKYIRSILFLMMFLSEGLHGYRVGAKKESGLY
jgi:hypothetical protein